MQPYVRRAALRAALLAGAAALPALPAGAQAPLASPSPAAGAPVVVAPAAPPAAEVDWKTATELSKVDFTGLTPQQKETALQFLREEGCNCGCGMKLAECRVRDKNCPVSPTLAQAAVNAVKEGKSGDALKQAVAAAAPARPTPPPPPALLDETRHQIPTEGAGWKGAEKAKVVIHEFSDFQ